MAAATVSPMCARLFWQDVPVPGVVLRVPARGGGPGGAGDRVRHLLAPGAVPGRHAHRPQDERPGAASLVAGWLLHASHISGVEGVHVELWVRRLLKDAGVDVPLQYAKVVSLDA